MIRQIKRTRRKQRKQHGGFDIFTVSRNGNIAKVQLLLDQGVDINKPDMNGSTPLFIAAQYGHLEIVNALLEKGADINKANNISLTPLIIAILNDRVEVVKALLEKGADINITNNRGATPLHLAAYHNVEIVKALLEKGADINKPDTNGDTPLYNAAEFGDVEIVNALLEKGADINIANKTGATPLFIGVEKGDIDIVNALLEKGADINKSLTDGTTPLYIAAENDNVEIVEALLEKGADINKADTEGTTPLLIAAERGHVGIVDVLLEKGADINKADTNGLTPLFIAAQNNYLDIVNELLEKGADINKADANGATPLFIAVQIGDLDIVNALLEKGPDINKPTNTGATPLLIATQNRDVEIVKLLLENDADINKSLIDGTTPLYMAAQNGHVNLVKVLLENGAHIDDKIKNNIHRFNNEIQQILSENSISIKMWEGWTSSDAKILDTIFTKPRDYAACPFCLTYVERIDACMYMKHNCKSSGGYYHTNLYNLFKNPEGHVYWCTICGRPCIGHKHCVLSDYKNPSKEFVKRSDGSLYNGNPFDNDCSIANEGINEQDKKYKSNGGGGVLENITRFKRVRNIALQLEDYIGKMPDDEAKKIMIEENWNAPLQRELNVKKILNTKTWNFPSNQFKNKTPQSTNNIVYPDILRPEPNATNLKPLYYSSGFNAIGLEESDELIQFRHRQEDGTINYHENDKISKKSLEEFITASVGNIIDPRFGFCYSLECNARLYPSELKGLISDELYEKYRKAFNQRFKATTGGGSKDFFREATDAQCVLSGGRFKRTRKQRARKIKKTKKTKSRR
jgi:ankyrin repeat protein